MKSTINLFKALPIREKKKKTNKSLMKKTIKLGFIFSPEVIANYSDYDNLIKEVEKVIGINAEKLNNAFHKSWIKIKESDLEELVVEQIAHYLTTYGKEGPEEYLAEKEIEWGVPDLTDKISGLKDFEMDKVKEKDYIYIPTEALKIPKLDIDKIPLVIIKGYTKEELKERLINLLNTGIALSEDTKKDILDVAVFVEITEKDIEKIKNKEVKSALYDYLNIFPENPIEFLRFIIYKATNKTLIIKNKELINEIKEKDNLGIIKLFNNYDRKYGLERLAQIFYRFKPLFLAFRTNKALKKIINRIRRLAVKNHLPMPEDYLNEITAKLNRNEKIDKKRLEKELEKVNIFRKIRLAYALKFRTKDVNAILYRIRNGKGYATEFKFENKKEAQKILDIVLASMVQSLKKNLKGKSIYIPDFVHYSLPATEKQFTGNFPSGSYISVPKDMVFGIHWENVGQHRIDLDLSLVSVETGKIGWDARYRTDKGDILFSGDMTDASKPKGATELFYLAKQTKKALLLFVNYYNFEEGVEVPFKIIVAKEMVKDFGKNYMVNPNNLLAVATSKINKEQKILGLIITDKSNNRFYFAETNIGNSITSSTSDFAENSRKFLFNFYENTIELEYILKLAGAKIVRKKDKNSLDLSPEAITKESIINLLQGKL